MQKAGPNRHAVFFTHPREAITYNYERNPADPRVSHAITLEVDSFGNVLKSLAVAYGRRTGQSELTGKDKEKQEKHFITYSENRYTNAVCAASNYRTPLPCDVRTYELTGFSLDAGTIRFSLKKWKEDGYSLIHSAAEINYEDEPEHSSRQKRLIEHSRTLYRKNSLDGFLPLGRVESLALPGESYVLAFTPNLIDRVFQRKLSNGTIEHLLTHGQQSVLGDEGGYISSKSKRDLGLFPATSAEPMWCTSDKNGHWWVPSGQMRLFDNTPDNPVQELAYARQHFFLPRQFLDPFGRRATTSYQFNLLVSRTADSLGNTVLARFDYRVLQPSETIDPNHNHTVAAFDTLGLVAGTAIMGKVDNNGTSESGDNLSDFKTDLTDDERGALFQSADPHAEAGIYLKNATARLLYNIDGFYQSKCEFPSDPDKWQPSVAATLSRENHVNFPSLNGATKIQIGFTYSDGFGREVQKKIQAEPGKVPKRDAHGTIIIGTNNQPEMTREKVSPRWVGSGWTVFNNKGKPVRQYEPFFTDKHSFEFDVRIGVSPIMLYDPLQRVVATLHPNHTYEKIIFDPWKQTSWDVNDTVLSDPSADDDIKGFFWKPDGSCRIPEPEYKPTWYAFRTDNAYSDEREDLWPDPRRVTQEMKVAEKAAVHRDTPTTVHFDTLGRPFLTISLNRFERRQSNDTYKIIEEPPFETRVLLDIEGNQREVIDALGRKVMQYDYTVLGPGEKEEDAGKNRIHQSSMEAGERWIFNDVAGNPVRSWDSRGHRFRMEYDELRRPIRRYVSGVDDKESDPRTIGAEACIEVTEYGEAQADAIDLNLRTRVFRHSDSAGRTTNKAVNANTNLHEGFDFKGNLLRSEYQLVMDYKTIPNWTHHPQVSNESFIRSTRYDALNRPIQEVAPHSTVAQSSYNVTQRVYNEANLLDGIDVWLEEAAEPAFLIDPKQVAPSKAGVKDIDYDAKGQRVRINYKNHTMTAYEYDPFTFRLVQLKTVRGKRGAPDCSPVLNPRTCEDPPARCSSLTTNKCILQDLNYVYDPAGNITHIQDDAQQIIYFKNKRVEPSSDYRYDSLYRLIEATGREHLGQNGKPIQHSQFDELRINLPHPGDGNAMGTYREEYTYDALGNFVEMAHRRTDALPAGRWTRKYKYLEPSLLEQGLNNNRLSSTTEGSTNPVTENYTYDTHGNMTSMPGLEVMEWDYRDQLLSTSKQVVNNGNPETTWYVYDAGGQRIRKVTEMVNEIMKDERAYLGEFEVYQRHAQDPLIRETLNVMEDKKCITIIEKYAFNTPGNGHAQRELMRHQLGNHLGSTCLELNVNAEIVSYEEYAPYGGTTYQAVLSQKEMVKQCRYSGKIRDGESGLCYYGVRYYATWLGRWVSCDTVQIPTLSNLYQFCDLNPLKFIDETGLSHAKPVINEQEYGEAIEQFTVDKFLEIANHLQPNVANLTEEDKQQVFLDDTNGTIGILLYEFLTGTGPANGIREFSQQHAITRSIMELDATQDAIEAFYDTNEGKAVHDYVSTNHSYQFSPSGNPMSWGDSIFQHAKATKEALIESDWLRFFLGGITYKLAPDNGSVGITVLDAKSRNSLFLHAGQVWDRARNVKRDAGNPQPLSTTQQSYSWQIDINPPTSLLERLEDWCDSVILDYGHMQRQLEKRLIRTIMPAYF